jgi:membrane protein DedA with SNARE-associated domain
MDPAALVREYGYLAVFAGAFLEGETILVLAGFAAHRGYLSLTAVITIAFVAGTLGDQFYFFLGRRWGARLLARIPWWDARAERFRELLHRHHTPVILGLRFVYGFRTVGALVIGMSPVPARRFVPLNIIGAAIWAVTVGLAGYLAGSAISLFLKDLHAHEGLIAALIALSGLLFWLWRWR